MTISKTIITIILIVCISNLCLGTTNGPYFGQTSPGNTPLLFAPGILTQPGGIVAVTRIAFSPDGNECFFSGPTDWNYSNTRMYYTKYVENVWTPHELVSFFPGYSCRQPHFSADGNTLYFSSNKNGTSDIWMVEHTPEGWGEPQCLPEPINSFSYYDGMYTQTTDGTIYIESMRPGGRGGIDIWRISPEQPGQPQQIQNLGSPVNTGGDDNDPLISCDGKYLIFGSNYNDLFVTFNYGNGGWSEPVNLNQLCPDINTGVQEYAPFISADRRYLFFSRTASGGIHWVNNPIPNPDPNGSVLNLFTNDRFSTIQAAVIYARTGDIIEIQPGFYQESFVLDKDITIRSVEPNDPFYIGGTIIQGNPNEPVVDISGNSPACAIEGLTIRAGSVGITGTTTNATIRNCRIMDNLTHGIELFQESNPHLKNCLITGNSETGIMMHPSKGRGKPPCSPVIENCIIIDNRAAAIEGGEPVIVDSLIQD